MESEHAELMAFYRRYLERCNDHRFEELDEFVDDDVRVNGTTQGLDRYVAGLRAVVEAFPTTTGTFGISSPTATGWPPT
jgi:predicted ester cyclase